MHMTDEEKQTNLQLLKTIASIAFVVKIKIPYLNYLIDKSRVRFSKIFLNKEKCPIINVIIILYNINNCLNV